MGITDYLTRNPEGPPPRPMEGGRNSSYWHLNKEKDRTLYPEIEREVRTSFLKSGTKAMCVQKQAILNQIIETKVKGEATKPRDAVKLAPSLSSLDEQPITNEKQLRLTKSKRQNKGTANQLLLDQNLISHSSSAFFSNLKIRKNTMASNLTSKSASQTNYHRINSRPLNDGDTDSVVEASRQDSVHEIKTTKSELLHLKRKS